MSGGFNSGACLPRLVCDAHPLPRRPGLQHQRVRLRRSITAGAADAVAGVDAPRPPSRTGLMVKGAGRSYSLRKSLSPPTMLDMNLRGPASARSRWSCWSGGHVGASQSLLSGKAARIAASAPVVRIVRCMKIRVSSLPAGRSTAVVR